MISTMSMTGVCDIIIIMNFTLAHRVRAFHTGSYDVDTVLYVCMLDNTNDWFKTMLFYF